MTTAQAKHPGFYWIASPTHDWHIKAPGRYHWAAYERDGTRHHGYADSFNEAWQRAQHAVPQP